MVRALPSHWGLLRGLSAQSGPEWGSTLIGQSSQCCNVVEARHKSNRGTQLPCAMTPNGGPTSKKQQPMPVALSARSQSAKNVVASPSQSAPRVPGARRPESPLHVVAEHFRQESIVINSTAPTHKARSTRLPPTETSRLCQPARLALQQCPTHERPGAATTMRQ
jgi:hypothetical protein